MRQLTPSFFKHNFKDVNHLKSIAIVYAPYQCKGGVSDGKSAKACGAPLT